MIVRMGIALFKYNRFAKTAGVGSDLARRVKTDNRKVWRVVRRVSCIGVKALIRDFFLCNYPTGGV